MSHPVWIDLSAATERQVVETDVCIIGAGAAGLYLAAELGRRGIAVVLIEAGPAAAVEAAAIGFNPVFSADMYPGATTGRFLGLGGSTTRWGGALVPHTAHDRREGGRLDRDWAHIVGCVNAQAPTVLSRLGYSKGADFNRYAQQTLGVAGQALTAGGFDTQASLLLPFTRKNLLGLLGRSGRLKAPPRVFFNAVAKTWAPRAGHTEAARLSQVRAVSRSGHELTVNAHRFVIAAGTLESARLLLEIDESGSQPLLRAGAAAGCYLADHLSVPIADVAAESLGRASALFAPRFAGPWMRGIRLLEQQPGRDAPRAFAHFIFTTESPGFTLAKELLGAVQGRRLPRITPKCVMAGMGDLMKLAYHQYAHSRLYIPKGKPIHLQLDMEQHPVRENRVQLTDQRDEYGRRVASIHWRVSDQDMASITTLADRFLSHWPGERAHLPDLHARVIGNDGSKPYDAYHPVGTCRMGDDAEAVVDHGLKVRGVENLWVVSTGVLPSAGTANPTFTMLCLAQDLAEHLAGL